MKLKEKQKYSINQNLLLSNQKLLRIRVRFVRVFRFSKRCGILWRKKKANGEEQPILFNKIFNRNLTL